MEIDLDNLRQWIGEERETLELLTPRLANSMSAVLDRPTDLKEGDVAPVGIHWCIGPEIVPMHMLGEDGHPSRGDFLPPVPLPRRMWAGGHLQFSGQFHVGDQIRRLSRVSDISAKNGSSGALCFVTVTHEYSTGGKLILRERHDIVYRDAPSGRVPEPAKIEPTKEGEKRIDVFASVSLLQRYSAAMLNGHRIHYDREYCVNVEGYPALVVHGPLQATFMLSLATQMNGDNLPREFGYRALRPLFDGYSFSAQGTKTGGETELWITNHDGATTMKARAES